MNESHSLWKHLRRTDFVIAAGLAAGAWQHWSPVVLFLLLYFLPTDEVISKVRALPDGWKKLVARYRTRPRNPVELRNTAYHEAGHALVAWFSPASTPPKKVTVIKNENQLGEMEYEDDDSDDNEQTIRADIRVSLAGSVAEEMKCGGVTTGSREDFADATEQATEMVTECGMGTALGNSTLLGTPLEALEPELRRKIRREIRKILNTEKKAALKLLTRHSDLLEALAEELLHKKTLNQRQIAAILGERPALPAPETPQRRLTAAKKS